MISKQKKHDNLGFTIIELVIVIAIASTLILVLFSLFEGQMRNYGYQQAQLRVAGGTRSVIDNMMTYTMQASNVVATRTVNGVGYTSDSDTIILELPTMNGSYDRLADTYDYVVFNLDGTNLNMVVAPNASSFRKPVTKRLDDSINSFSITYNNVDFTLVDEIDVSVISRTTYRGNQFIEVNADDTFFLRNIPRPDDE